nr:unnamed protein product [Digitaria exilis]
MQICAGSNDEIPAEAAVTTSRSESLTWSTTRVAKLGCAAYKSSNAISKLSRLFFPSPVVRSSITPTCTGVLAGAPSSSPTAPPPAASRKTAARTAPAAAST